MTDFACPIWQTPAASRSRKGDSEEVDSARAGGRYFVSRRAAIKLANWNNHNKVLLTTWLVEQRRLGVSCPKILEETLDEVKKMRPLSVFDRADALLRHLDGRSDLLGTVITFPALHPDAKNLETADELLAWTASQQLSEVVALCEYCTTKDWIKDDTMQRSPGNWSSSTDLIKRRGIEQARACHHVAHQLTLRPPGYAHLAELKGMNPKSSQAFVAMWFDPSTDKTYQEGIQPAIENAGYESLRIDKTEHNNKIDDEIIAAIRRSRFLIADFTQGDGGARGGVYYEAGFAYGLNIPVIFTCHKDGIEEVHLDTRQYNHIIWTDPDDLRERLVQRISATIGDGPLKEPL